MNGVAQKLTERLIDILKKHPIDGLQQHLQQDLMIRHCRPLNPKQFHERLRRGAKILDREAER